MVQVIYFGLLNVKKLRVGLVYWCFVVVWVYVDCWFGLCLAFDLGVFFLGFVGFR